MHVVDKKGEHRLFMVNTGDRGLGCGMGGVLLLCLYAAVMNKKNM